MALVSCDDGYNCTTICTGRAGARRSLMLVVPAADAAKPRIFKNCTAVKKVHAHGIAKNFKVVKTADGLTGHPFLRLELSAATGGDSTATTTASLPAMPRVAGESLPKGAAPSEENPGSAPAASRDGSSIMVIMLAAAPAAGAPRRSGSPALLAGDHAVTAPWRPAYQEL